MSFLLLVMVGCAHQPAETCPASRDPSNACDLADHTRCLFEDHYSTCNSEMCSCEHGTWSCHNLASADGDSCTDSPLSTCQSYGHAGCSDAPTTYGCACGADGTWHCTCICYGLISSCGICPTRFSPDLDGALCEVTGHACPLPDGHRCDCVDVGSGPRLQCT